VTDFLIAYAIFVGAILVLTSFIPIMYVIERYAEAKGYRDEDRGERE
jgi:hypothetical protein